MILLLEALRRNEPEAVRELWGRYFARLRKVARQKLGPENGAPFDSEDVALSAFNGFCRAVQDWRYPELNDQDSLWALLVLITRRKAKDYSMREAAQKRASQREDTPLDSLPGSVTPPDIEAIIAEECRRLFDELPDQQLVRVAVLKLEGWTNDEIANEMNYTRRTIQRMLNIIRGIWHKLSDQEADV
jgi:RNA polymerase sigma factor (sigma-70 family)